MRNKLQIASELIDNIYRNMITLVNLWQVDHDEVNDVLTKNYPFDADLWELAEEVHNWKESVDEEFKVLSYKERVLIFALDTFLSSYPEEVSPGEIMDAMNNGEKTFDGYDEIIEVWEPFMFWDLPDIADQVDLLYRGILELTEKDGI